jgi:hypothetical protein
MYMYNVCATPTKLLIEFLWTATIFLHAHLQVMYYTCVKFHKTPINRLGGVALTRYTTPIFVKL